MLLAIDFDGVVVEFDGHAYNDLKTPLKLLPGAREGLAALRAAGHQLVLWSARANRALRDDPQLDPLVRAGAKKVNLMMWSRMKALHEGRYQQMLDFVAKELPQAFDAIDDGQCGKLDADVFIDDRAVRFARGLGGARWIDIAKRYGARAA